MAKLDRAATAIHQVVDAPIVAFGHSHRPVIRRMAHDHRAFYVNTGNFLQSERTLHEPGTPCNCPHTFAVVETPQRYQHVRPRLNRWCGVEAQAVRYERGSVGVLSSPTSRV